MHILGPVVSIAGLGIAAAIAAANTPGDNSPAFIDPKIKKLTPEQTDLLSNSYFANFVDSIKNQIDGVNNPYNKASTYSNNLRLDYIDGQEKKLIKQFSHIPNVSEIISSSRIAREYEEYLKEHPKKYDPTMF